MFEKVMPRPAQASPWCNNLAWLHHLKNKHAQTCLNFVSIMSIWKKLKLAINQLNLFELVQAQKNIYRAVLDSFWILFFPTKASKYCITNLTWILFYFDIFRSCEPRGLSWWQNNALYRWPHGYFCRWREAGLHVGIWIKFKRLRQPFWIPLPTRYAWWHRSWTRDCRLGIWYWRHYDPDLESGWI